MDLAKLTLKEAIEGLEKKNFSSIELTKACLNRIAKYNKKINCYVTVDQEGALQQAKDADTQIAKGTKKLLLGIPISLKDNWNSKGMKTTATSKILDNYISPYDATATKKLKDAGAVIVGKNNMDAWGHGSSGEHSDYGNTLNPWNFERVPGGSSSGSGAAITCDMVYAATGTDTGGSIRQPAAFCNVVGLKPTYGRVSRYGIIMMGSSFDSIGHLTKTVWDNARILSVTAGYDPYDGTSSKFDVQDYEKNLSKGVKGIKIGVPKEYFAPEIEEQTKEKTLNALKELEKLGAELISISLPHTKYAYPVYGILQTSEVSSNLARYDGIRYGLERKVMGDEGKRRIMIGTHSLSTGYADKYYHQAQKGRTLIIQDFNEAYKKVDVIVCPVWPFPPFKIGERSIDPLQMYLADVLTAPMNDSGNPSLAVPAGFTKDNLPIGMQIVGPNFREDLIYQVGYAYESVRPWYKQKPNLDK